MFCFQSTLPLVTLDFLSDGNRHHHHQFYVCFSTLIFMDRMPFLSSNLPNDSSRGRTAGHSLKSYPVKEEYFCLASLTETPMISSGQREVTEVDLSLSAGVSRDQLDQLKREAVTCINETLF